MTLALSDIATARAGYAFRSSVQHDSSGDLAVIQGRDVDADALYVTPSPEKWQMVSSSEIRCSSEHLLQKGDILFMARGSRNYAVVVDEDLPAPCMAVASFHILRPNRAQVAPVFLAWLLNQDSSQTYFRANNTGTTIPMVNLDMLKAMPVRLPPMVKQLQIADLIRFTHLERVLMTQLAEQRQLLLRAWATENL
jgi:hypothetical protein